MHLGVKCACNSSLNEYAYNIFEIMNSIELKHVFFFNF